MTNTQLGPVVDADGHVLEPGDMYPHYIDPQYRDRALRIAVDEKGYENLIIDNKPYQNPSMRGNLGAIGGIGMDREKLFTRGMITYAEGSPPGGYDPKARLKVMDDEGIDMAVLYPTLGIFWEGSVQDPKLATAYTRAYNRWIVDFCRENPKRLYAIAHISLLDPDGAVEETLHARKEGCVGVYLSPDLAARQERRFDDPVFIRFWETVQELEMPVAFHVVVREQQTFHEWTRRLDGKPGPMGLFGHAFLAIDVIAAFTSMLSLGMFEKYPRLKCAVLEAGATWIGAWLDRLDYKSEVTEFLTPIKLKPSEYFYRQCVISADPDETMTAQMVERIGADYFIWASDYPHIDASFGVVKEMKERLASLPLADQRKVLGENAVRFYNLTH
ncbi:MAG TPA: amidohydrolase family protein [Candidatus Binatia bacterium]|jgi:predicted TIM-barrel fold metal-dependent hydrolase|nr:amidohydrolase family protein [Candidatus Binatia bacterium]